MFSGKTTTEALSWERLHQQQNLGSVKLPLIFTILYSSSFNLTSNLTQIIGQTIYVEYLMTLFSSSSNLSASQLQVDMLSMLHGATPSYENLGGMFPGQYQ